MNYECFSNFPFLKRPLFFRLVINNILMLFEALPSAVVVRPPPSGSSLFAHSSQVLPGKIRTNSRPRRFDRGTAPLGRKFHSAASIQRRRRKIEFAPDRSLEASWRSEETVNQPPLETKEEGQKFMAPKGRKKAQSLKLEYAGTAFVAPKGKFDGEKRSEVIEVFKRAAAELDKLGIKFIFHNHGAEFVKRPASIRLITDARFDPVQPRFPAA